MLFTYDFPASSVMYIFHVLLFPRVKNGGGGSFDFIASLPSYIDYRMFMHYIGENLINNLVGIYGMHLVKIHIYGNILVYEFS